jgi:hypothetical protein
VKAFWQQLLRELPGIRLTKAIKGVLWCILHGTAVGGFIGGIVGLGLGAMVWLVGALIGFPVGVLIGAAVGGLCGLAAGVLGGRQGWIFGPAFTIAGIAMFLIQNNYLLNWTGGNTFFTPINMVFVAGIFTVGAIIGGYCYNRVWNDAPGMNRAAFQEWRERLRRCDYEYTTLTDRILAGWAIVGTVAAIVTLVQRWQ